ncbi:MAG: LapA family protein [Burkholderiaceae bacterium]|jgi:uncharacterized integral membrane protein|nr:LapA family protein [Burkholderiaceae bacterium]
MGGLAEHNERGGCAAQEDGGSGHRRTLHEAAVAGETRASRCRGTDAAAVGPLPLRFRETHCEIPPMRYLHIAIIVLLTALVLTFKVQNLQSVTVQFLSWTALMPVMALILLIHLLGMFTGGSLWSLFKRSYRGAFPASKSV